MVLEIGRSTLMVVSSTIECTWNICDNLHTSVFYRFLNFFQLSHTQSSIALWWQSHQLFNAFQLLVTVCTLVVVLSTVECLQALMITWRWRFIQSDWHLYRVLNWCMSVGSDSLVLHSDGNFINYWMFQLCAVLLYPDASQTIYWIKDEVARSSKTLICYKNTTRRHKTPPWKPQILHLFSEVFSTVCSTVLHSDGTLLNCLLSVSQLSTVQHCSLVSVCTLIFDHPNLRHFRFLPREWKSPHSK
jgi:hypothetical protein